MAQNRQSYRRKSKKPAAAVILAVLAVLSLVIWFRNRAKPAVSAEWAGTTGEGKTYTTNADGTRTINWDFIMVPDWIERDLIPVNPYSRSGKLLSSIDGIVVHYTANPGTTAKQNRNYFAGLADGSGTSASSHFIIDTDGTILQCVPMSEIAYASNDRNRDTLSIECCHEDESGKFTKETYQSLVKLTAWLCDTYGLETDQVIRHYDVTGKLCPKYYVEHEDKWDTLKKDIEKAR
ncbi:MULTISPECIES: peptidoglycan recognition protein family protein [unclassified Candidatus Paralachnospira]|uniref:peptidoglycan recognition protein family protein n=1 Tax=unclassified Candidatus Paralachnospira TaxID=3099471 RepID=UPI003F8ECEDD